MDRRLFLTGLLGLAGTAALASTLKPGVAEAAVLNPGNGILDELDTSDAEIMNIDHRHGHRRRPPRRRPRRRRVWRRVCRRVRVHGRWRRVCRRERVWI